MDNLFIKTYGNKLRVGSYECLGAGFYMMLVPEKYSVVSGLRLKRQLRRFKGAYIHTDRDVKDYGFCRTDGSLCMIENIEELCRKLCKNHGIEMPPKIGIADTIFAEESAEIVKRLGRICSEIYIFTESDAAESYQDYMLYEYGAAVCVRKDITDVDILIAAEYVGECSSIVIDLHGDNSHLSKRVSGISVQLGDECDEYILPHGVADGRLYDFLRISGMKKQRKIKIIGYMLK